MSNASFMVKTKVDHLAERVTKIIFEVNKYIIAIEEMKTDARGRKSWKGACNRAIRKLVTLKGKLEYVLEMPEGEDRLIEANHFIERWELKSRGGPRKHMDASYAHHVVG